MRSQPLESKVANGRRVALLPNELMGIWFTLSESNIAQARLAKKLGLKPNTLNQKLNGKRTFTLGEITALYHELQQYPSAQILAHYANIASSDNNDLWRENLEIVIARLREIYNTGSSQQKNIIVTDIWKIVKDYS